MKRRRFLAVAMVAFATACRTLPFPEPHLEGEYGQALKKWTRRVALYAGLETRAFVRIVYLSPSGELRTTTPAELLPDSFDLDS